MKKDNKATFYIFIGSADEGAVKHLSNTCNTFVRMCHSAVCSCFASGHLISVNLQRVHYLWIYVYIYRFAHPRHAFASYVLFLVVNIVVRVCYCHSHCVMQRPLLQVFSPVHVPRPLSISCHYW